MKQWIKLIIYIFKKKKWKLWKCVFGFHVFDWFEWSRNFESPSVINFHCARCQDVIKTIPFDDIPEIQRNHILDISNEIKRAVEEE